MGKSSKPTIGYRHFMYLYMGESIGPNDYLAGIKVGGQPVFEGGVDGGAVFDDLAVLTVAVDADDVVTGFADGFGGVGQDGDGVVVTVTR